MVLAMLTSVLMIVFIGICLVPFMMALGIYALIIGIMILTGKDHRIPYLANYVEENYV